MRALRILRLLAALMVVMALAASAALAQDVIKWNQPPDPVDPGNLFYGWNELSQFQGPQIAADDWVCTSEDPVTDIHWWGSFINWRSGEQPPQVPDAFHIAIWTDVPTGPNDLFSHPGVVVWEGTFSATAISQQFVGWDYDPRTKTFDACFRYDLDIPEKQWFYQDPMQGKNIYWISIAAVYSQGIQPEYPWGWKTRPRDPTSPAPDDAVRIFDPTAPVVGTPYQRGEPIYWPDPEQSWDLAFELTTQTAGVKWEQLPNRALPGLHCHDSIIDTGLTWIRIADDWKCQGGLVTDFHWWGNYEMSPNGELRGSGIRHFHLSIHPDVGGLPGPEIWGLDVTGVPEIPTGIVNVEGSPIYRYDYVLPQPFPQEQGVIYWFDVTAYSNDPNDPAQWRWQEFNRNPLPLVTLSPAAATGPSGIWNYIFWPSAETYSEMAYRVTSGTGTAVKWSQPPQPYTPTCYNGWNEFSTYGDRQIVADDWLCVKPTPVTDIHWWGSFINWSEEAPPRMPDAFHMAIWTDVPAGVDQRFSHPGQVLWENICSNYTWEFVGWDIDPRDPNAPPEACFKFDQLLNRDEWFYQEAGDNIYWISIAAIYKEPTNYPWGWKTRPRDPKSLAPDDAVRIFDPTAPLIGSVYGQGQPIFWPSEENSWDAAFVLTTTDVPVGTLTVKYNHTIPDHFWWPSSDPDNEMISLAVTADPTEAIRWDTITLQASGSGNDATDISQISVWLDNNNDAVVDPGDTLVGTGVYPTDDGTVTISLAPAPVIPASAMIPVIISYTMTSSALPGSTYTFSVIGASGTGQTSLQPVTVVLNPNPLVSARKIVGRAPITIGQAKLLPLGDLVFLQNKEVTAVFTAPGWPVPWNWVYIEEPDRSAGIGMINVLGGAYNVGDKIDVLATTTLVNSAELMLTPQSILSGPGPVTITPLGMNNRSTGGAAFGQQPGVVDNALVLPFIPSYGLNNVGMLIRTWGRVTGHGGVSLGGSNWADVTWIDDGTNLHDGYTYTDGTMSTGIAVVTPTGVPAPMTGYWGITGILRAIQNPIGQPVRLLVPRDYANDCIQYAP